MDQVGIPTPLHEQGVAFRIRMVVRRVEEVAGRHNGVVVAEAPLRVVLREVFDVRWVEAVHVEGEGSLEQTPLVALDRLCLVDPLVVELNKH